MQRFLILTKGMLLIHLRERSQLFWNFAFPIFLLVIYGAIFGGKDVTGFMTWTMPGILTINILAFGLISSSTLITEMRAKGVLRRLQASPAPAAQVIGAYLLVNVLICLLQSALIVALAIIAYGVRLSLASLLLAGPMIAVSALMAVALGQAVSSVSVTSGTTVAVGQLLYFGQMFIADLIMPIQNMPAWVQKVGPWLPGYAMAQLVRPALQNGALSPEWAPNLLLAVVYGLAAALIAARFFKWETQ